MVSEGIDHSLFLPPDQLQTFLKLLSAVALDPRLGGSLGDFTISFMVPLEVPFQKYFKGPQNYNPAGRFDKCWARISDWHSEP